MTHPPDPPTRTGVAATRPRGQTHHGRTRATPGRATTPHSLAAHPPAPCLCQPPTARTVTRHRQHKLSQRRPNPARQIACTRQRSVREEMPKVGVGVGEEAPPGTDEVQLLPLGGADSPVTEFQDGRAGDGGDDG